MKHLAIFIPTLLVCAACNDDNGNRTPPPTQVVAPPPNNAPTITLATIPASLDERQSFTLDASQSTDPDGDILTYDVAFSPQDIAFLVDSAAVPTWVVETTEIDQDVSASVTVTVSDGRDSVSETLDFVVENYDRSPLSSKWGAATDTYQDPNLSDRNFGWSQPFAVNGYLYTATRAQDNSGRIQQFRFLEDSIPTPTTIDLGVDVTGREAFYRFPLDFSVGPDFVLHSEETDEVQIFRRETNSEVSDAGRFTIPESCSIGATQVGDSTAFGEPLGLIVGTPNGLTALVNNGDPASAPQSAAQMGTFSQSRIIATTGDFCELDYNQFNTGENARFFDKARGEISRVSSARFGTLQLGTPIAVNAPSDMTLVDIAGGYSNSGEYFTALLFAGETHSSDHQLTIISQFFSPSNEQVDIPLPHGIPTSLYVAPISGSFLATDIIVTVPETPYIYLFENVSPFNEIRFEPIEYLDVGFDVRGVEQIRPERGSGTFYLVTNDGEALTIYPSMP